VVGVRQDSAAANPLGFTVMTASGAHFQKTRTIPVISFHTMACREENISEIAKTGLGPEEENEYIPILLWKWAGERLTIVAKNLNQVSPGPKPPHTVLSHYVVHAEHTRHLTFYFWNFSAWCRRKISGWTRWTKRLRFTSLLGRVL
jgi:hypothetical protein